MSGGGVVAPLYCRKTKPAPPQQSGEAHQISHQGLTRVAAIVTRATCNGAKELRESAVEKEAK